VPGLVGRSGAAPILFDAFARLGGLPAALAKAPKGAIFAANNRLPPPLQRFRTGAVPTDTANPAPRIMFPPNGARLAAEGSELALKISGGVAPLTLLVNGVPRATGAGRRTLFFTPDGPGFARLTVMDARGVADSVVIRIE
jgi:penicillin-binding protein 1C